MSHDFLSFFRPSLVELLVKYYDVLLAGQDDVVVTFEEADTAAETPAEESGDTGGRLAPHRPAPPSPVALAKMSGSTRRHGSSTDLGGAAGGSTSATNQQHFLPTSAHAPSVRLAWGVEKDLGLRATACRYKAADRL